MSAKSDDQYLSAADAAALLGVSIRTLYGYVGRKGIRFKPVVGSRQRCYSKSDIERVAGRERVFERFVQRLKQDRGIP